MVPALLDLAIDWYAFVRRRVVALDMRDLVDVAPTQLPTLAARYEARFMPHAQYVAVVILVDGLVRAAQAFEHQTDTQRWAEEQRVLHAGRDR